MADFMWETSKIFMAGGLAIFFYFVFNVCDMEMGSVAKSRVLSAFFRGAQMLAISTATQGWQISPSFHCCRFFLAKSVDFRFHKRKCTPFIFKVNLCFCCISFGRKRVFSSLFLGQRSVFVCLTGVESVFCGGNGSECQLFDIWTFKLLLEGRELKLSEPWARETPARMQRKWIQLRSAHRNWVVPTSYSPRFSPLFGVTNWWRLEPVNVVFFVSCSLPVC